MLTTSVIAEEITQPTAETEVRNSVQKLRRREECRMREDIETLTGSH